MTVKLVECLRHYSDEIDRRLHREIRDVETIHRVAFTSFLEAALNLRGRLAEHLPTLQALRSGIKAAGTRAAAQSLAVQASEVLGAVEETVKGGWVDVEGSIDHTCQVLKRVFGHPFNVNKVLVVDALSLVEFASLRVLARRSGVDAELGEVVFINPLGVTRWVKDQTGYLMIYASRMAEAIGAKDKLEVYRAFDKALDTFPGDVMSFLDSGFFSEVWGRISSLLQQPRLYTYTILLTSDHGYNVYEEDKVLTPIHGPRANVVLDLDKVSVFLTLVRRW